MSYLDFAFPAPKDGLIGHRGVAALAPENTLSSFVLASEQGIGMIEFDVRLTKDEQLVIFHDDTLERTTNGQGWVHEHHVSYLSQLDAGSWFHPQYHEEKIPVFSEILPLLVDLKLNLNIELKLPPHTNKQHGFTLIKHLLAALKSHWPTSSLPLISSFHWELLAHIRQALPSIPLGFLSETCSLDMLKMVGNIPNAAFHCDYQGLAPDMLAQSRELNVPVLAYTVNQPAIAKTLFNSGIFAIFSDNPHQLLQAEVA